MWKILQHSPPYFIKFVIEKEDYVVSVTNYLNIWVTRLSKNLFLQVLKDSDEYTVFENDDDLLEKGICMVSHPEQLKSVTISENDGTLKVSLTKFDGFLMFLNLSLVHSSNVCMFAEVIQPLLMTVKDLRESEGELRQELKKKDKEIEEYKCEGGEIALRHLKTVMFDDTKHMKKHRHYEENFSDELIEQLIKPMEESKQSKVNCNSGNKIRITEVKKENTETNISASVKTENLEQETVTIKTEPTNQEHRIEISIVKSDQKDVFISGNVKTDLPSQNETCESATIKPESMLQDNRSQNLIPPRKRLRNRLNF